MQLPETHRQLQRMTRRFADEVIRPKAEELDRDERLPVEISSQMAQLDLFGITVPAQYLGAGMDVRAYAVVMEELSRG